MRRERTEREKQKNCFGDNNIPFEHWFTAQTVAKDRASQVKRWFHSVLRVASMVFEYF